MNLITIFCDNKSKDQSFKNHFDSILPTDRGSSMGSILGLGGVFKLNKWFNERNVKIKYRLPKLTDAGKYTNRLHIYPGGNFNKQKTAVDPNFDLVSYLQGGGNFLGICAGALHLSKRFLYKRDNVPIICYNNYPDSELVFIRPSDYVDPDVHIIDTALFERVVYRGGLFPNGVDFGSYDVINTTDGEFSFKLYRDVPCGLRTMKFGGKSILLTCHPEYRKSGKDNQSMLASLIKDEFF